MDRKEHIYDISLALHRGLPVWPGDPPGRIIRTAAMEEGAGYNLGHIDASLHWGTHIDAPYHIVPDGWTIDQIPLSVLMGPVRVLAFPQQTHIGATDLMNADWHGVERILFKTRNSDFWNENPLRFHPEYTALTPDAARLLLKKGVKLIGIDYLSIDLFEATELPVHHLLYARNVVGIEGLDLRGVPPGDYQLICLPVNIKNGDGAYARVILQK